MNIKKTRKPSNRPFFLSDYELTRLFELKEACHCWHVIATKMNRKRETLKKRYQRETAALRKRTNLLIPRAIVGHRLVVTSAGTTATVEYEVLWEGSEVTSWKSLLNVQGLEVYGAYSLRLQMSMLKRDKNFVFIN